MTGGNISGYINSLKKRSRKVLWGTFLGLSMLMPVQTNNINAIVENTLNAKSYNTIKNKSDTIDNAILKHQKRYVVLCFDDCNNLKKWNSTLRLADTLSVLSQKPAHFSYYINETYLTIQVSGKLLAYGAIVYSHTKEWNTVIQSAIDKGHDIGSHTVRHVHCKDWTESQWKKDLVEFDSIMANDFHDTKGLPYKCIGFRAPFLNWNESLYPALKEEKYEYDISRTGDFVTEKDGIKVIGTPRYERKDGTIILGMDYNWHRANISDSELETMLDKELTKVFDRKTSYVQSDSISTPALIISMHFNDWKTGEKTYYQVVSNFLIQLAKTHDYQFISVKEYVDVLKQ